jgi:hypothetical protein
MVLSETLRLWLSLIVREGIGCLRDSRVLKHGPDLFDCYFPPKSSVSKSPTVTAGKWFPKMDRLSARGAQAACGFK